MLTHMGAAQGDKIDVLRTPGCLGGESQLLLVTKQINRRRFARVGATGKGNFRTDIRRHVSDLVYSVSKLEL